MENMDTETGEMIVKRVSVPIGLEELMEGLVKEVLLKKPDDIYLFAARYFANLLTIRDRLPINRTKTVRTIQTMKVRTEKNPAPTKNSRLTKPISIKEELPVITPITSHKPKMHQRNELKYNRRRHTGPQTVIPNVQQIAIRRKYAKSVSGDQQKAIMETNNNKNKAQILREKLFEKSVTKQNNLAKSNSQNKEETKKENPEIVVKQVDPIKEFVEESAKLVAPEITDTLHRNLEKNRQSGNNKSEHNGLYDATKIITDKTNSNTEIDELVTKETNKIPNTSIDNKKQEHSNKITEPVSNEYEVNSKLDMDDNKNENITNEEVHTVKPDLKNNEKDEMFNNKDKEDKSNKYIQKSENSSTEISSKSKTELDDKNNKIEEIVLQILTSKVNNDKLENQKEKDHLKNQIFSKPNTSIKEEDRINVKTDKFNEYKTIEEKYIDLPITEENELNKNKEVQYHDDDIYSENAVAIPFNKTVDDEVISKVLLYSVPNLENGEPAETVELNVLKSTSNEKINSTENEQKINEITKFLDNEEITNDKIHEENKKQDEKEFSEDSLEFIEEKKIESKKLKNKESNSKNENIKSISTGLEIGRTTTEEPISSNCSVAKETSDGNEKYNIQAAEKSIGNTEINSVNSNVINTVSNNSIKVDENTTNNKNSAKNLQVDATEIKSNEKTTNGNRLDKENSIENINIIEEKIIKPFKLDDKEVQKQTIVTSTETGKKESKDEDKEDQSITDNSITVEKSVNKKTYHNIDSNTENNDQASIKTDYVERITKTNSKIMSASNNLPGENNLEESKIIDNLLLEIAPEFDVAKFEGKVNADKSNDIKSTEENEVNTDNAILNIEAKTKQDNVQMESAKIIAGNNAEITNIDVKEKQLLTDNNQLNNATITDENNMQTEKNVDFTNRPNVNKNDENKISRDELKDTAKVENNNHEISTAHENNENKTDRDKINSHNKGSNNVTKEFNSSYNIPEQTNEHKEYIGKVEKPSNELNIVSEQTTRYISENYSNNSEVNVDINDEKSDQTDKTHQHFQSSKDSVKNLKQKENNEVNKIEISTIQSDNIIKNNNEITETNEISDEHIIISDVNKIIEKNNISEENKIKKQTEDNKKNESEILIEKCKETIKKPANNEDYKINTDNKIGKEKTNDEENIITKEKPINDENTINEEKIINNEITIYEEKLIDKENTIKEQEIINEENTINEENKINKINEENKGTCKKVDSLTNKENGEISGINCISKNYLTNSTHTEENKNTETNLVQNEEYEEQVSLKGHELVSRDYKSNTSNFTTTNIPSSKEDILNTTNHKEKNERKASINIDNTNDDKENIKKENIPLKNSKVNPPEEDSKILLRNLKKISEDANNGNKADSIVSFGKRSEENEENDLTINSQHISDEQDSQIIKMNSEKNIEDVDKSKRLKREVSFEEDFSNSTELDKPKADLVDKVAKNYVSYVIDKDRYVINDSESLENVDSLNVNQDINNSNEIIENRENQSNNTENTEEKTEIDNEKKNSEVNEEKKELIITTAEHLVSSTLLMAETGLIEHKVKNFLNDFINREKNNTSSNNNANQHPKLLTETNSLDAITSKPPNGVKRTISFDSAKLHQELEKVDEESKLTSFKSSFNPFLLRKEIEEASTSENFVVLTSLNFAQISNATVKIQRVWRKFRKMKHIKNKSKENAKTLATDQNIECTNGVIDVNKNLLSTARAALLIQKIWKGFKARKQMKLIKIEAHLTKNTSSLLNINVPQENPELTTKHKANGNGSELSNNHKFTEDGEDKIASEDRRLFSAESTGFTNTVIFNSNNLKEEQIYTDVDLLLKEQVDYPTVEEENLLDNYQNKLLDKISGKEDSSKFDIQAYEKIVSPKRIDLMQLKDEVHVPVVAKTAPKLNRTLSSKLEILEEENSNAEEDNEDNQDSKNAYQSDKIGDDSNINEKLYTLCSEPALIPHEKIADKKDITESAPDNASKSPSSKLKTEVNLQIQKTPVTSLPIEFKSTRETENKPESLPDSFSSNASIDSKNFQTDASKHHNEVHEISITPLQNELLNKSKTESKPEEIKKTSLDELSQVFSNDNKNLQDSATNHHRQVQDTPITPLSIEQQNKPGIGFKPEKTSNKTDLDNLSLIVANASIVSKNLQDSVDKQQQGVQETLAATLPIVSQNKPETQNKSEEISSKKGLDDLASSITNAGIVNKNLSDTTSKQYHEVQEHLTTTLPTVLHSKLEIDNKSEEISNKTSLEDVPLSNTNIITKNLQKSISKQHHEVQETLVIPIPTELQNKLKTEAKIGEISKKTSLEDISSVLLSAGIDSKDLHDTVALSLNEQQVDTGRVQPILVQLCETSESENLMTPRRPTIDVTDAGGTLAHGKAVLREDAPAPDRPASDPTTGNMESGKRRKVDGAKMEAQAAAKIQAGFRGYQVRKQLKLKNGSSDMTPTKKSSSKLSGEDSSKCPSENCEDIEEQSAVKIQAGIRGFLVRRRQKKLNSQHT